MTTASIDEKAVLAAANLLRDLGATQVFIFGSAIRGELRRDSDIDMAVTGLPSQVYFSAISKASDLLGRPLDLVDLDDATPLVRYLLDSGELVSVASHG
jgi:predicted nucleotidyltransferase